MVVNEQTLGDHPRVALSEATI